MSSLEPRYPYTLSTFGRKVRDRRQQLGLTQTSCAEGALFSNTWLAHLEAGRINPKLVALLSLADALDTTIYDLIGELTIDANDRT